MPERLRVFVNPTIDERGRQSALKLAKLAQTEPEMMTYPLPITEDDHTIFMYGGDGSGLSAVEGVLKLSHPEERLIGFAPFGSFNGTAEALKALSATITPEEAVKGQRERAKAIRPGLIDDQPFHHGAAWGAMSVSQVLGTEGARGRVPKRMRAYLGALFAAMKHPKQLFKENVVSVAFTSPFFGHIHLIPEQDFEGDQIAVATVKGGRGILPRLSSILYSFIVRRRVPKSLLDVNIGESHTIIVPEGEETIVADAELRTLKRSGEVKITRSHAPIYMAVLID